PRQVQLYTNYAAIPLSGPLDTAALGSLPERSLVLTRDWWLFHAVLAGRNCPRLDCGVVYAYAPDSEKQAALRAQFGGRQPLEASVAGRARRPALLDQPCPPMRLGVTGYLQRDGVAELWGVANLLDRDRDTLRGIGRLVTAILVARVREFDPGAWNLASGEP